MYFEEKKNPDTVKCLFLISFSSLPKRKKNNRPQLFTYDKFLRLVQIESTCRRRSKCD